MIKSFSKEKKRLFIQSESGKEAFYDFDVDIEKALLANDVVIVMTDTNRKVGNRNIFGISEEGKCVWQVEEPKKYLGADSWRSVAFSYLGLNDKGGIIGGSLNCFNYEIDSETGKLFNPVFSK